LLLGLLCFAAALGAAEPGFRPLFDGKSLDGWQVLEARGPGWIAEQGVLVCQQGNYGRLLTRQEYGDFVLRLDYRFEPGANNGVNIRAPLSGGRPAFVGMEIQILDDTSEKWSKVTPEQRTGSLYDVLAAKTGVQKPAGEWNTQEITADRRRLTVKLNGTVVLDADLDSIQNADVVAKHPGLKRPSGYLGFMAHGQRTEFRNIRIKTLR
jgi:hypothetical protein